MGMSTHIIGFKAPDENWKKMKAVYDSCLLAGIDIPDQVLEFFNYDDPAEDGVAVDLEQTGCVLKWNNEMKNGYVVDLVLLRKEQPALTHIRFYNSY